MSETDKAAMTPLTVEWVHKTFLEKYESTDEERRLYNGPPVPVVRVEALREQLERDHETCVEMGKREAAGYISYLLALLPKEEQS